MIIEIIPNLHPLFVHFTVALLITSCCLYISSNLFANKYENELLIDQLSRLKMEDKKVHYHKIWALEEGKRFSKKRNNCLYAYKRDFTRQIRKQHC